MVYIQNLIKESRKLIDYASCMSMATGYRTGELNSAYYSLMLQKAEYEIKEILEMDLKSEFTDKIVKTYFEQPDRTLKELFEEYTEDFTKEEKEKFFSNLKSIVS